MSKSDWTAYGEAQTRLHDALTRAEAAQNGARHHFVRCRGDAESDSVAHRWCRDAVAFSLHGGAERLIGSCPLTGAPGFAPSRAAGRAFAVARMEAHILERAVSLEQSGVTESHTEG